MKGLRLETANENAEETFLIILVGGGGGKGV